jgi:cobalt-zinc-cadmium efflux system outer membrane protein
MCRWYHQRSLRPGSCCLSLNRLSEEVVDVSLRAPVRGLFVGAVVAATVLSACVRYVPKPLDLVTSASNIDARTLTDPALGRVIEPARQVPSWPPDVWDLSALTVAALYYQPDLELARANWALARAGIITAGERPNPTVAAGPGYNSTTPAHTITPWILNLNLDFTIETAGKRGYRIDQAQRLSDSARFTIAATAWNVRTRLRQTMLDLFAATQAAAVLDRQRGIQENNVTLLQRQLTAGAISTFEMTQARLTLDTIRLAVVDAQRQQQDARARLATAVGIPVAALEGIRLGLDPFMTASADIGAATVTREALLNRADVLSALSEYDASQSALQLEIARQYPDLHLGPGYQMDQGSNKWTILAPFVLPAVSRNRGPIAQGEARRAAAATQVTAVQARAIGAVDRALAAYQSAQNTLSTAEQLLGEVRSLEATTETQLAAGDISQLDLGLIQSELASRELSRLSAIVQVQQAIGDLEDAMQRPIDLPVNPLPVNPQ